MSLKTRILIFGLILLGIGGYLFFTKEPPKESVAIPQSVPEGAILISLTENGFSPDTLTIRKEDTVFFRTVGKDLFWPASNLHPSHGIYPEFDPLEPLQPTEVWSFTFDKVGEWKYHDHLAPYFTGVITVTE